MEHAFEARIGPYRRMANLTTSVTVWQQSTTPVSKIMAQNGDFVCKFSYCKVVNAGWDRECGRRMKLIQPMKLKHWYIVFPIQMERDVNKFISRMIDISKNMDFEVLRPKT